MDALVIGKIYSFQNFLEFPKPCQAEILWAIEVLIYSDEPFS